MNLERMNAIVLFTYLRYPNLFCLVEVIFPLEEEEEGVVINFLISMN